jgi:hypothetical protein
MQATKTNYTPKVKAEEAGGNKWARIQAELATSARKENQGRAQNANNGWGQSSNPFDMNAVLSSAQTGASNANIDLNAANQAAQNQAQSWLAQLQPSNQQQTADLKNTFIQMGQQTVANQQAMEGFRAQLQRSANSTSAPASDWMNAQNMYGQAQDQARVADERSRAAMSAQIAAQQYQQNQANQQARDNNEAARHLAVIDNQKQQQLANTQANAQVATARIGADAGVLSSMFSSFGGGGGFRYW